MIKTNDSMIADAKNIMALPVNDKLPKLRNRAKVASSANPREELKKLVQQHKALTKAAVSVEHMASDRVARVDFKDAAGNITTPKGAKLACRLPADVQAQFQLLANEVARKAASKLEKEMVKQLKQIPVYQHFLSKVYGCGPIVAAYLVSEIDIHRAVKSSAIRRFCGLAVINGRLERREKGKKSAFSSEMRTRLYQMTSAMWKNGIGKGKSSKYLKIWTNAKHRKMQMAVNGRIDNGKDKGASARGYAHSYGWHKCADIFVEDLYIIWRTLEGLDVFPSYYAAKLGYSHGGKICVNAPKKLSLEEALETVGDVGGTCYTWSDAEKTGESDEIPTEDEA